MGPRPAPGSGKLPRSKVSRHIGGGDVAHFEISLPTRRDIPIPPLCYGKPTPRIRLPRQPGVPFLAATSGRYHVSLPRWTLVLVSILIAAQSSELATRVRVRRPIRALSGQTEKQNATSKDSVFQNSTQTTPVLHF
jgi:hypothetical protein